MRTGGLAAGPVVRRVGNGVALLVGLAGLLAAADLFVRFGSLSLGSIPSPDLGVHPDFPIFWASARAFLDGGDIYATPTPTSPPNLNPPALTLLLAPLGWLDQLTAYRVLALLTLLLVVGAVALAAREVRLGAVPTAAALALVLLSSPVLATVRLGQVYGLLLAGLTVAWLAHRRDLAVVEGIALGVVVAVKPSLAPVLLLPLVQRRWRAAGVGVVALLVATAVPLLRTGPGALRRWYELVAGSAAEPTAYPVNASLPGTGVRLTTVTEWSAPVLRVAGGATAGLVAGLLVLAVTAWVARHRAAGDPAVWALAAAGLLASPVSWQTYLVVLVPGLVIVASRHPAWALAVAGPALIGEEWIYQWRSAVPLSLYAGVLLVAWLVIVSVGKCERNLAL